MCDRVREQRAARLELTLTIITPLDGIFSTRNGHPALRSNREARPNVFSARRGSQPHVATCASLELSALRTDVFDDV